MTRRVPCPPAPGPLDDDARQFDDLLGNLAQRRAFRASLQGLLLPRERTKTRTGLAGTEPVLGAQAAPAQRLQWFLSESSWDADALTTRRRELLCADPATRPHDQGVRILDETGERKDGTHTAQVAQQDLGSVGRIANGIVSVTSRWADADVSSPLHGVPSTPARRLPGGNADPAFRTTPQLATLLLDAALTAGVSFRAVVADGRSGEHPALQTALWEGGVPSVLALRAQRGTWAPADDPHTPEDAARQLSWSGPAKPGGWPTVIRPFRDEQRERWWAADLPVRGHGWDHPQRLVALTTDPARRPATSTWDLLTNRPHPQAPQAATSPLPPADLAEITRLYGLRTGVEQGYTQGKQELGWADWQVRADRAIRRHWALGCCAFSCWCWAWSRAPAAGAAPPASRAHQQPTTVTRVGRGKHVAGDAARGGPAERGLAGGAAAGAGLAAALDTAVALVARLVGAPAATPAPSPP
jgi:DDE superfamily endonuclease